MRPRDVSKLLREAALIHALVGSERMGKALGACSWAVGSLSAEELEQRHSDRTLTDVRGIGTASARVIAEILDTGAVARVQVLKPHVPAGVLELARVRGLGPSKVKVVWKQLGVTSLGELEQACLENRLLALPGFGVKTQDKVLAGVQRALGDAGLFRRDEVERAVEQLRPMLDGAVERWSVVGAYRRGDVLVDGLRVLIAGDAAVPAVVAEVPVTALRCGLEDFGVQQIRHTGPDAHVAALDLDGVQGVDEDSVYAALGFHAPSPERRGAPLVPLARPRPRLVRREDLRGALHNHTVDSDGRHTLQEMQAAAAEAGLTYLGISEHSQSAAYARGMQPERLRDQIERIHAMAPGGCVLLTGVESDVLRDGSLDYSDDELAQLDVVVASVHQRFQLSPQYTTARMIRAARNPHADVMGHPTGRLLKGRPENVFDMEAWLQVCAETGVAVELNCSPRRLDLDVPWLVRCKELGVPVSISADAHSVSELGNLRYGITLARAAGLGPHDVLNTRSVDELREWLAARG
jgi:DNA polymerase (family 10)